MALEALGQDQTIMTAITGSYAASTTVNLKEDGSNVVSISPAAPGVILTIDATAGTGSPDQTYVVQVSDDGGTSWALDPDYTIANLAVDATRQLIVRPILPHETDLRVQAIDESATTVGDVEIKARLQDIRKVTE